ncbi:uncharacterized protein LOC119720016 [Patiria miniata]|uniref:Transmembrane protein n=1 Tax=Patiria miniata TaxID=46514 RepID=A0A913Z195_PATMI|nr:uncharacterized protein LOC119720016 [Patiria miniata]
METSVVFMLCFQCGRLFWFVVRIYCDTMRFCMIIAILLSASVVKTVSPAATLSTISGPIQGSLSTSALPEDCLSTIDLKDIVFISAVPIAAGFGLLLLLTFLQDLRQACKSKPSCPSSPCNIQGNRARKERAYVIDIDYTGRSRWGAFLRWCAMHKSPGANKNPHLVRLQGTTGFSDWLSFDLILGKKSEQKTLTTLCSIGKLVAVETKFSSASDGLHSRLRPTSNLGACLRGIINRACDIEINNIHVTDTKTQDHYISGCGPSCGGISSSDLGITTILPLLLSPAQPVSRVSYTAYYFKNGSLWTSAFTPWRKGNFTGCRHITCLFTCISYTMVAVQVMSEPYLQPSLGEFVVVSPVGVDITVGMIIKAAGVSAVLFPVFIMIEVLCRTTPTILSSCGQSAAVPLEQSGHLFVAAASGTQPVKVQSAAGSFCDSGGGGDLQEEFPQKSVSTPDMQRQGARPSEGPDKQTHDTTSYCNNVGSQCVASSQDEAERQLTQLHITNDNNNNEVTIIEIHPCDEPSTSLPVSTNSHAVVDMETSQSSSNSTTTQTGSSMIDTASSLGESASANQDKSSLNLKMFKADLTKTTNKHCSRHCKLILAAFGHTLLIATCVFATLWSVSSFHGLCWNAFWEWVATSIIAILIQAVILDTIKAIIVTVMKRRDDKRATTSTPHSLIQ